MRQPGTSAQLQQQVQQLRFVKLPTSTTAR